MKNAPGVVQDAKFKMQMQRNARELTVCILHFAFRITAWSLIQQPLGRPFINLEMTATGVRHTKSVFAASVSRGVMILASLIVAAGTARAAEPVLVAAVK